MQPFSFFLFLSVPFAPVYIQLLFRRELCTKEIGGEKRMAKNGKNEIEIVEVEPSVISVNEC